MTNIPQNCGFLQKLMPENQFYKANMNIFKKCIPSACESVYREIFVPHHETLRLSSKP